MTFPLRAPTTNNLGSSITSPAAKVGTAVGAGVGLSVVGVSVGSEVVGVDVGSAVVGSAVVGPSVGLELGV